VILARIQYSVEELRAGHEARQLLIVQDDDEIDDDPDDSRNGPERCQTTKTAVRRLGTSLPLIFSTRPISCL
jgi:hypothetical protein